MLPTEYHIDITAQNSNAVHLLSEASGLSNTQIKQAMKKGAVWSTDKTGTHRIRRATKKLSTGTVLHFYHNPEVLNENIPRTDASGR